MRLVSRVSTLYSQLYIHLKLHRFLTAASDNIYVESSILGIKTIAGREQVLLDAYRNPKASGSGACSRMVGVLPVRRFGASSGDQLAACNCIRGISAARLLAVERSK
jgi:hypothetical protein